MQSGIDIIIPTYNRPHMAAQVLLGLESQLAIVDKVIIVWQGKQQPDITTGKNIILVKSVPPNLPRARNLGITYGHNPIVLFLDDDIEICKGLLDAHRRAYENPKVGAVAGRLSDENFNSDSTESATFDETTGRLIQNFCVQQSGETISVMGANMSFRRKALLHINGFDEQYLHNALWEEVDAAFRLRRAGFIIEYRADAKVIHRKVKTGGCRTQTGAKYLFNQFANTTYFAKRFASRKHKKSWIRYWKYRLEYESRKRVLWMRHDPVLVIAGCLGVCAGIFRFVLHGRKR
jgi:GT2 family glycosyltransferase